MRYNYAKILMQIKTKFVIKVKDLQTLKNEMCHSVGKFYSAQNYKKVTNRFTIYDLKDKFLNILQELYSDECVSEYNFKFVAVVESNKSFISAIDNYAKEYNRVLIYRGTFYTEKMPQICCTFVDKCGNEVAYIFKYSNIEFINLDDRSVYYLYLKHLMAIKALYGNMPSLTLKNYDFSKITNPYDNFIQFLSTLSYADHDLDNLELILCNTIQYLEKMYNIDMDYSKKEVCSYSIDKLYDIFVTQSEKVVFEDEFFVFTKSVIVNIMKSHNENLDYKLCDIFALLVSEHKK